MRQIRLLDDRHGADGLYRRAAQPLRAAYALLDAGITARRSTADRLHSGAGELAISVGWLAHDSGRFDDARSHYAEALATARVSGTRRWRRTPSATRRSSPGTRAGPARRSARRRRASGRPGTSLAPAAVAARAARGGRLGGARRPHGLRTGPGPGARATSTGAPRDGRPGVDVLLRRARAGVAAGAVLVRARRLGRARPATRAARRRSRTRASPATSRCTGPSWRRTSPTAGAPDEAASAAHQCLGPAGRGPVLARPVAAHVDGGRAAPAAAGVRGLLVPGTRHAGDGAPGLSAAGRRRAAFTRSRWPVSFQRSIAGDPYAQPEHRQRRRVQAGCAPPNDGSRPSQRAPDDAQDVAVREDQHVAVGGPGPLHDLVRPRGDIRDRLPARDPVAPDEPVRPAQRLDLGRRQPSYAP